jgi:hypothetical protein
MMSKNKITITFTEKQAWCLRVAASEVMDHDVTVERFPDRGERRAAENAYKKLTDEYFKQKGQR